MQTETPEVVSRRRYQRAVAAREEAEALLEDKSRALFEANEKLSDLAASQEQTILNRTQELREALHEAEEAITARSRFIATMSHEIRTPLGGILGMIDILLENEVDPEKCEFLNHAKNAGTALKSIVNDVLDLSRMERQSLVLADEAVDIRALLRGVIALFETQLEETERKFFLEIDTSVPPMFRGDATRVRQVISNLTSNAVRYSESGNIHFRISMKTVEDKWTLRFEIEDEGIGIAPERIDDLFKDFSQIHNELTQVAESSGLGLAICKRIIEAMQGEIGVLSEVGLGTVFWFEIPVEVAQPVRPTTRISTRPLNDASGMQVLVAEDNLINQKIITTFLTNIGVGYDLAENGRVAIEMFEAGKFDAILMDVAMPEVDGFQAIREICAQHPPEDIPPIIILTAHVTEAIQHEAGMLSVTKVLNKPISKRDLQNTLASLEVTASPASRRMLQAAATESEAQNNDTSLLEELLGPEKYHEMLMVFDSDELQKLAEDYLQDARKIADDIRRFLGEGSLKDASKKAHSLRA